MIQIIATGPSCIYQQKPKRATREKRVVPKVEENWLNGKPFFAKPVEDRFLQPYGTALPWHAITFPSPHTELSWLMESQSRELASFVDEFRTNGLAASSLSSSSPGENDDDMEAANYAERCLDFVPDTLDPMMVRRIEWERFWLACGQANRIYVKLREDGTATLACTDRRWSKEQLATYADKLRELASVDLGDARDRAEHYRKLVWSLMTPDQQLAWTQRSFEVQMYLNNADDNHERESWPIDEPVTADGPKELGFHDPEQVTEPTELDLWEMTEEEIVFGIVPFDAFLAQQQHEASFS